MPSLRRFFLVAVSCAMLLLPTMAVASVPNYGSTVTVPGPERVLLRSTAIGNLVANGGFESGWFEGWQTSQLSVPYIPWGVVAGNQAEGSFRARNGFDGNGPGDFLLWQDIAIPAQGRWVLSWSDALAWNINPGSASRMNTVEIRDPASNGVLEQVYVFEATSPNGTQGWTTHSVDVSAFAGSTIRLTFHQYIPEPFTGPAEYSLDDVRLTTTGLSIVAPAKVAEGKRVTVKLQLALGDAACGPHPLIDVSVLGVRFAGTTADDLTYAFSVKVSEPTRIAASFNYGGVCAPADAGKTIQVR